jgi:hypothetical protein
MMRKQLAFSKETDGLLSFGMAIYSPDLRQASTAGLSK